MRIFFCLVFLSFKGFSTLSEDRFTGKTGGSGSHLPLTDNGNLPDSQSVGNRGVEGRPLNLKKPWDSSAEPEAANIQRENTSSLPSEEASATTGGGDLKTVSEDLSASTPENPLKLFRRKGKRLCLQQGNPTAQRG